MTSHERFKLVARRLAEVLPVGVSAGDLTLEHIDAVESVLLDILGAAVCSAVQQTPSRFDNNSVSPKRDEALRIGSSPHVHVFRDVSQPDLLIVSVADAHIRPRDLQSSEILVLKSVIGIRKLCIQTDASNQHSRDALSKIVTEILTIFESVIFEILQSFVRARASEAMTVSRDLVRAACRAAGTPELADNIWMIFTIPDEDVSVNASDPIDALSLVTRIEAAASEDGYAQSTAQSLVAFLGSAISYRQTFSSDALREGRAIDVDLSEARYKQSNTAFLIAQSRMFGTTGITIYPLFSTSRLHLTAIYPTIHKTKCEQILTQVSSRLASFSKIGSAHLKSTANNKLNLKAMLIHDIGSFLGAIINANIPK